MHAQKGFTIVELIAVITIVGVMSAVAAPRFVGNDAFQARGAYSTLLSVLRFAQKTAVAQRKPVYAKLDTATRVICLGYDAACSSAVIDPATQAAYSKTLPSSVTLTTSANPVVFDGKGASSSTISIRLQNNVTTSEAARTITVEQETGYVY